MKKHRKQQNHRQPAPEFDARAATRAEEEFARQLDAMLQAELGSPASSGRAAERSDVVYADADAQPVRQAAQEPENAELSQALERIMDAEDRKHQPSPKPGRAVSVPPADAKPAEKPLRRETRGGMRLSDELTKTKPEPKQELTLRFESIRRPGDPEQAEAAKAEEAAAKEAEDRWSDEALFAAVDAVLAYDIFSGLEKPAPLRKQAPEPVPVEPEPAMTPEEQAAFELRDTYGPIHISADSKARKEPLPRDTEPLPSLEELFPTPAPAEPEPVPVEEEPIPAEPGPVPVEEEPVPAEPEPAPIEEKPVPAEPEPAPIEEEPVPVEPEPAPIEEEIVPVEEEPTPVEEEPTPIEEEPAPVEEEPVPAEPEPAPVEEEPVPVEPEPAPIEEEIVPVEEEPAPIEEEILPVEPEPAPVEEEPAPVEEETAPIEEEPVPAEPEPAPVEEESAPAEPESVSETSEPAEAPAREAPKSRWARHGKEKPEEPRRRRLSAWLAELLHPKFEEEEADELTLFSSDADTTSPSLLSPASDALPEQLTLEGFLTPEAQRAAGAEFPEQLPLDGFAPEAPLPAEEPPAFPETPLPAEEPPAEAEGPAPEAEPAAPEPAAQSEAVLPAEEPPEAPAEEEEGPDGPDLISAFRKETPVIQGRGRRSAHTLQELLAAAVPMEDAEPPMGAPRPSRRAERAARRAEKAAASEKAEKAVSIPPKIRQEIATVQENPAGLVGKQPAKPAESASREDHLSVPDPRSEAAEKHRGPEKRSASADRPGHPAETARRTDVPDPETAFTLRPKPPRKPETPAPGPDTPAQEKAQAPEPVPSASVRARTEGSAPAAPKAKPAEKTKAPEKVKAAEKIKPVPAEEPTVLHPEEASLQYARPLTGLSTRLILTGLCTILSLFFTLYLSLRWRFLPEIFSGGTTTYVLLALLFAMLMTNSRLFLDAIRGAAARKPGPDLLILLAALCTALDTYHAAEQLRPQFTVVIGLLLLVSLWGKYDSGLALLTTVKVLREPELTVGVSEVQDITKGSRGLTRTDADVDRFMEKLETRDLCSKVLSVYTPIAVLAGLAVTLLITFGLKLDPFWTGSLVFIGCVPLAGLIAFPRLFLLLSQRLSASRAALCGYHGAEVFGGDHAILIGDDDVFPAGSLTLNGFKVYNGSPERIIAYSAAATRSSGSALAPLFEELQRTHAGRRYSVDAFRFYDSGGIGATIIGDVVLMGSLDFMRRMGVHMDKGAKVRQAVYASINGELAAVFAIKYAPPENLRRGLASIAGNRHFKGILVTRTFLGTPNFLKSKFGIPLGSFSYPSTKERLRLSEAELKNSGAQGAILTEDSFTGFAQAAAGGRMLRSATVLATVLALLGGAIGLVLMGALAALPAYETVTAVNLLLYVAAWLAPALLLTTWARHF